MSLRPLRHPNFVFSWIDLIAHRHYMPKMLSRGAACWGIYRSLILDLFCFLEPFLSNVELTPPLRLLYKGTLRVLLVLLHDFPEFLCDNHFHLCDLLPPTCIQMRNLILSAFPRNMRLPDPFTPHLKVDRLPEINLAPRISPGYISSLLHAGSLKQEVDSYLKSQASSTFLAELPSKLVLPDGGEGNGSAFNVPLINSLVLYLGIQAIAHTQSKAKQQGQPSPSPLSHTGVVDIFQYLVTNLNPEGRYLFLNAIANQLRYPNNHTHYFSCVLLYLFAETTHSNPELVQEQITRVLLERLIVNRPHPWGLLITFIELIKNSRYQFWTRSFTRCTPEIERLFESVSNICKIEPTQ